MRPESLPDHYAGHCPQRAPGNPKPFRIDVDRREGKRRQGDALEPTEPRQPGRWRVRLFERATGKRRTLSMHRRRAAAEWAAREARKKYGCEECP